ncbi:hypothetical protein [Notoacmeibacter ruber]|uniref:Myb-like domain-containing protein n=1 Tax=Notoacmeibacter ruber TaxID=2670375 RepID=A0A3L7JCK3_9HYPH|nr:hypothetical protein [Notoacmeibacter ruber]RLQ88045.1 hypothetical protein D8780_07335 [Notoacmeibacter ruber]
MSEDITPAMRENEGKDWSDDEIAMLRQLNDENAPVKVASVKLGRPPQEIKAKCFEEKIDLHMLDD